MSFVADFETTTDPNDCRVWAWAVCEIGCTDNIYFGNTLDSFMEFVEKNPSEYWFHNLKFDGEFIIYWLLTHDYYHNQERANLNHSFKTLISNTGQFYSLDVCFSKHGKKRANVSHFKDSLKKLPMSVEQIAKAFNLPLQKLELDYSTYREIGHELTEHEIDYITNDVVIVAKALEIQFENKLNKLTIGSDALNWYKSIRKNWDNLFPVLNNDIDAAIRKSYRGGWVYVKPEIKGKMQGNGIVLDVNSLYPSVMYDRALPIGVPVYYEGCYTYDAARPLYVQYLTCHIKLKKNHLPTIQIKGNPFFIATEYIVDSGGTIDLALTSVDLKLMMEHYDVDIVSWNGGYKFQYAKGLFCEYIDYWSEIKAKSTGGQRQLAKLMLNSLYGKFATNPDVTPQVPYLRDDGAVGYKLGAEQTREPIYTAIGSFITAYARDVTIRAAQANYDRFLYADTDSLHLSGLDVPEKLDIHPTRLGAWSEETSFKRAKYLRAKTYVEEVTHIGTSDTNGEMYMQPCDTFLDVKCAGAPKESKHFMTFENFKTGQTFDGKLRPLHVRGGIVLIPTTYTLL